MIKKVKPYLKRPALFEKSKAKFWDDPHISQSMLKAHLNPNLESATRRLNFVEQSAHWISHILPPSSYRRLLDLGCGPGIYAELFHTKGYQVTGFDISENSIRYAKKSAREKDFNISYLNGDYIKSPINDNYDLITMIYCDFGVLSHTERKTLLGKIYKALSPTGCFLFDVFTPYEYENQPECKIWNYEESGFWSSVPYFLLQQLYRYDNDNTFLRQYIVVTDDKTICYNNWEHTFEVEELRTELQEAGFSDIQFYGNVAGTEYKHGNKTICVIAKR